MPGSSVEPEGKEREGDGWWGLGDMEAQRMCPRSLQRSEERCVCDVGGRTREARAGPEAPTARCEAAALCESLARVHGILLAFSCLSLRA